MSVGEGMRTGARPWFVEVERVGVTALVSRQSRARLDEERTKSTRIAIVSSLFLVLFAAALLIGGHAAIDPLLQSAVDAREANGIGAVVYAMPDGIFCRHMSFDNVTAEVTEGGIERCPNAVVRDRPRAANGFSWSAN